LGGEETVLGVVMVSAACEAVSILVGLGSLVLMVSADIERS